MTFKQNVYCLKFRNVKIQLKTLYQKYLFVDYGLSLGITLWRKNNKTIISDILSLDITLWREKKI